MVYSEIVVLSISFILKKSMHALILFKKFLTWAGVGREFLFQSCAIIKKNRQIIIKLKRKLKKNLLIYSQITKDTFPLVVREREKKQIC